MARTPVRFSFAISVPPGRFRFIFCPVDTTGSEIGKLSKRQKNMSPLGDTDNKNVFVKRTNRESAIKKSGLATPWWG